METASASPVGETELITHLDQEIAPLTYIALDRRDNSFDTTYDHFIYDYIGHPRLRSFPQIIRQHSVMGERRYERPIISSYSKQGSLVQVRETMHTNPDNRAADFFVVTANLNNRETTEWRVIEVASTLRGTNLQTELILSSQPLDAVPAIHELELQGDPLQQLLTSKISQHQEQQAAAVRTRVVLTNQGCWFCPEGQSAEPLSPITELIQTVDTMYARFGHLALLRSVAKESGINSTETIAA